jgi:hypothetical protein
LDGSGPYIEEGIPIVANTPIPIKNESQTATAFNISFSSASGVASGDKWKISCRAGASSPGYFSQYAVDLGNMVKPVAITPYLGWSPTYSPSSPIETDRQINTNAVVTISIDLDTDNSGFQPVTIPFPPSDRNYENIEEWFIETAAYQYWNQYYAGGWNVGYNFIKFRRGCVSTNNTVSSNSVIQRSSPTDLNYNTYPMRMFIAGDGTAADPNTPGEIQVTFKIQQANNPLICETKPVETDSDIFHETSRTYPIDNQRNHLVNWAYDDFIFYPGSLTALAQLNPSTPHYFEVGQTIIVDTTASGLSGAQTVVAVPDPYTVVINVPFVAGPVTPGTVAHNTLDQDQSGSTTSGIVVINNPENTNSVHNAFTWGNGVESNRIKDDFNASTLEYSVRSTSTVEDYSEQRKQSSICYSGVYEETSNVNGLNDFNLSIGNFKDLERSFGSIQKIHTRMSDLLVLQENKITTVLFGKNILFDSVGGGQVASIPEVFGSVMPLPYENGISTNPESFAVRGEEIFFTDAF